MAETIFCVFDMAGSTCDHIKSGCGSGGDFVGGGLGRHSGGCGDHRLSFIIMSSVGGKERDSETSEWIEMPSQEVRT